MRLLVVDLIVEYACRGQKGNSREESPKPLLVNLGATSIYAYDMDIMVRHSL